MTSGAEWQTYIVLSQQMPGAEDLVVFQIEGASRLEFFADGGSLHGFLVVAHLAKLAVVELLVGVLRAVVPLASARAAPMMSVVIVVVSVVVSKVLLRHGGRREVKLRHGGRARGGSSDNRQRGAVGRRELLFVGVRVAGRGEKGEVGKKKSLEVERGEKDKRPAERLQ